MCAHACVILGLLSGVSSCSTVAGGFSYFFLLTCLADVFRVSFPLVPYGGYDLLLCQVQTICI